MKAKILHPIFLLLLPLCVVLFGAGCKKEEAYYENIPLEYTKCPCDSEMSFIKEAAMDEILLFDASKTSLSEMKNLSSNGERSSFMSYSPETDSTVFYSFTKISSETYLSIGYICNFPNEAEQWQIPSNGIHISFSVKVFEGCNGLSSVGFTQTFTDNILTSLKKHAK
jgi:hypothetical protein